MYCTCRFGGAEETGTFVKLPETETLRLQRDLEKTSAELAELRAEFVKMHAAERTQLAEQGFETFSRLLPALQLRQKKELDLMARRAATQEQTIVFLRQYRANKSLPLAERLRANNALTAGLKKNQEEIRAISREQNALRSQPLRATPERFVATPGAAMKTIVVRNPLDHPMFVRVFRTKEIAGCMKEQCADYIIAADSPQWKISPRKSITVSYRPIPGGPAPDIAQRVYWRMIVPFPAGGPTNPELNNQTVKGGEVIEPFKD